VGNKIKPPCQGGALPLSYEPIWVPLARAAKIKHRLAYGQETHS